MTIFGMTVIFQNLGWWILPQWILSRHHFRYQKRILHQGFDIHDKFVGSLLNSEEITAVFGNPR